MAPRAVPASSSKPGAKEMSNRPTRAFLALICGTFLLGPVLSACEEEGTAEQVGESIDESIEKTGEALEEAADEMEERTE
jgi:hypothetical protein